MNLVDLRLAAIDAYMYDCHHDRHGDCYRIEDMTVTRPSPNDGEGGGEWSRPWNGTGSLDDYQRDRRELSSYFASAFDQIRGEIDRVLAPVVGLPDPDGFDPLMQDLGEPTAILAPMNVAVNARADQRVISETAGLEEDARLAFSGGALEDFRKNFLNWLESVAISYYDITVVLGAALGGEKKLWQTVPDSVDDATAKATQAFTDHSNGSPPTWDDITGLLGVMADGVGVFSAVVAPEAALPIVFGSKAVAATLTLVTDVGNDLNKAKQTPAPSYKSIMSAFATDIANIMESVYEQEELLRQNLVSGLAFATSESWNLDNQFHGSDRTRPDALNPEEMHFDQERVREIYDVALPRISAELGRAKKVISLLTNDRPWMRHQRLGLGYKGCWNDWDNLRWSLIELLGDLAWETDSAAEALKLFAARARETDADVAAELTQLSDRIVSGSGCDPEVMPVHPLEPVSRIG